MINEKQKLKQVQNIERNKNLNKYIEIHGPSKSTSYKSKIFQTADTSDFILWYVKMFRRKFFRRTQIFNPFMTGTEI